MVQKVVAPLRGDNPNSLTLWQGNLGELCRIQRVQQIQERSEDVRMHPLATTLPAQHHMADNPKPGWERTLFHRVGEYQTLESVVLLHQIKQLLLSHLQREANDTLPPPQLAAICWHLQPGETNASLHPLTLHLFVISNHLFVFCYL